jgi:CheY-like chemotaxis protein
VTGGNVSAAAANTLLDADRPTVLVVEDEVLVRLLIADELRLAGFLVIEAVDAEEALSVLRSTPHIALLFTDVRMPGQMDGVALAETVTATWPGIKIILTSGQYSPSGGKAFGHDFVAKPYDPMKVVKRIRELLATNA